MAEHKTLRPAGLDDIDDILQMAEKLYKDSPYAIFDLDYDKARQMLEKFIVEGQKDYLVLLSHDEGKAVGVLAAYAFRPLFSQDKCAVEVLLWLDEDYRTGRRGIELLDAFEYWANLIGCKAVQYGMLSSSPQRMEQMYEKRGAHKAETMFHKRLK